MNTYLVTINGYFSTLIDCACSAIAIPTAIDYFSEVDDAEVEEVKVEKISW